MVVRQGVDRTPRRGAVDQAAALPTLAQLTSAEQRWADREEDITTVGGYWVAGGQVFARRWMERLTDPSHLQKLSQDVLRVPHRVDGELLRYAVRGRLPTRTTRSTSTTGTPSGQGSGGRSMRRTAAEHAPAGE